MNKLIPLAVVALLGSATLALAGNAFSLPQVQPRDNIIELGTVTTTGPGVVQIYEYNQEQIGQLLGSHQLMQGGNLDVKVTLEGSPLNEALAVLVVNNEIVAMQPVRFEMPAN